MRTWFPLLLGLAVVGLAALPAPAEDAATVQKLIDQLGADTYAEREAASKALEKIGSPALEAVLKATKSPDAEVRKRAAELSGKIGRRALSEAALAPRMVQLTFKDTPLSEAVQGLAQKSGYDVVLLDPEGKLKDRRVTLDTGKATFWAALEKFCAAAGVIETDPNAATLAPPPPAPGAIFVAPAAPAAGPARPAAPPAAPPRKGKLDREGKGKEEGAGGAASRKAVADAPDAVVKEAPPAPAAAMPPKGLPLPPKLAIDGGVMRFGYHVPVPPGRITLVPGEEKLPADTTTAIRVRRADPKRFPAPAAAKDLAVLLEVSVEPRLVLQRLESVQIDTATDDNDQPLAQARQEAGSDAPVAGPVLRRGGRPALPPPPDADKGSTWFPASSNGLHVYAAVRLKSAEKASKSLKRLEGTVTASVLGDKEAMLVVESPARAAGQSVKGKQGGEIHVTAVNKLADGSVQIEFEVEAPPAAQAETRYRAAEQAGRVPIRAGGVSLPALMPGQTSLYTPWGLTLQNDKGLALPASIRPTFRKGGGSKVEFAATYLPGKDGKGEPARLAYTARRQTQVQVPFRLAGVELK